jgi:hypothetical protein
MHQSTKRELFFLKSHQPATKTTKTKYNYLKIYNYLFFKIYFYHPRLKTIYKNKKY